MAAVEVEVLELRARAELDGVARGARFEFEVRTTDDRQTVMDALVGCGAAELLSPRPAWWRGPTAGLAEHDTVQETVRASQREHMERTNDARRRVFGAS